LICGAISPLDQSLKHNKKGPLSGPFCHAFRTLIP
jgi:hypothetical protein